MIQPTTQSRQINLADRCDTFVDVLRWRAQHQGEQVAFRFLQNGIDESCVLTYASLDQAALVTAARLRQVCDPGDRALLLFPNGPEYLMALFGCFYAGVIAVPLYPPRPNRSWSRTETVIANAQPAAALIDQTFTEKNGEQLDSVLGHSIARLNISLNEALTEPPKVIESVKTTDIAFLQYTSGSTSAPKGVMVTHGNLLENCRLISQRIGQDLPHEGGSWLPFFHDMGLIGAMFMPLLAGFPTNFIPPETFVMRPYRWLDMISHYQVTVTPAPNFAFDLCVQRTKEKQLADLDLSSWRVAFNGSERIDPDSLQRFADKFAPCGFKMSAFLPSFGLAEATLFVTGTPVNEEPICQTFEQQALEQGRAIPAANGLTLVSCGALENVAIVNPETQERCEPGNVGEIWVTGPSVTAGYWNRPGMSHELFNAKIANVASDTYLRTGDLGFDHEGQLYITGRLKDLIIIGGRNIYPEDVEQTAEKTNPAMSQHGTAAFSIVPESGGVEKLVLVCELDVRALKQAQNSLAEVEQQLRQAITAQHEITPYQTIFIRRNSLPKTTSGKKRRSECRKQFQQKLLTILN